MKPANPSHCLEEEVMIESGIQYKIVSDGIRDGPQIPNSILVGEWLREMPDRPPKRFSCRSVLGYARGVSNGGG